MTPMQTTLILNVSEAAAKKIAKAVRKAGGQISFEGTYTTKTPEDGWPEIQVHYDEDDSLPLFLCDENGEKLRELNGKESDLIGNTGAVSHILHTHPRAERYGAPLCATSFDDIWKATCGNLGFDPTPNLQIECEDSEDDSTGHYVLTIQIPPDTQKALEKTTEAVKQAVREVSEVTGLNANILSTYSSQSDEEIQEALKEAEAEFKAAGGRGVELADKIDELRAMNAMRQVLSAQTEKPTETKRP